MACEEITISITNSDKKIMGVFFLVDNGEAEDAICNTSDNEFCNEICELYEQAIS